MGKSAKFTRGGNKLRVNVGRLKAKIERYGGDAAKHSAVQDAIRAPGQAASNAQLASSLRAIQAVRQQKADGAVAVRMVSRAPAAAAAPAPPPPPPPAAADADTPATRAAVDTPKQPSKAPAPTGTTAGKKAAAGEIKKVRKAPK